MWLGYTLENSHECTQNSSRVQDFKSSVSIFQFCPFFHIFFGFHIFPGGWFFSSRSWISGETPSQLGCCCWKTNQPPGAVLEQSFQSLEVDPPSRVNGLGLSSFKSFSVLGIFLSRKKQQQRKHWSSEKQKKKHPQSLTWNLKNDDFQKESPFPGADFQLLNCRGVHQFDHAT